MAADDRADNSDATVVTPAASPRAADPARGEAPTRAVPTVGGPTAGGPAAGGPTAGGPGAGVPGSHVTRGEARDAVAVQRARFGGIKWGAAFFGWLSATGLAVILVALLAAGGVAVGLSNGVSSTDAAADQAQTIGLAGAIGVLVVLFLAYLAGGYVAGRMARFDGARQGLAVWVIGIVVVVVLAIAGAVLGAQYNVLQQLNLPRIPIDEGTATTAGVVTLVALLVATLLGALVGGKLGERYHRRIDRVGFDAVRGA
jgi:MFS family permease